ncbi:hypothetical protein [Frigoriflavimonas asaccharolytica]|uniref:Uncharacterized protein n=1 Tax=Frigoriflavimonas asaccharolytica TaxID=2735899 RepID=A0A8J8KA04_9FLAO|nr:hypothetical protein [Frigoriflavimonas asaccharolytica]NRS90964.1 hypothetical protein [Frigoriflavimonas asaccharolytica]
MKKIDLFGSNALLPTKETIQFILAFSKNLSVLGNKKKTFLISKN